MYPGLSEYFREMRLLNITNISIKWDVAYSDGFYAIFHVHDLIAGRRMAKGLEPRLGSTIQENAFFS